MISSSESKYKSPPPTSGPDPNDKVEGTSLFTLAKYECQTREEVDESGWTKVYQTNIEFPIKELIYSNLIQINDDEYIVATAMEWTPRYKQDGGLWIYNVNNKNWKFVLKYDLGQLHPFNETPKIAYNKNTKDLYIYSTKNISYPIFFSINLLTQKYTKYDETNDKLRFTYTRMLLDNNNNLHIYGHNSNDDHKLQHVTWDFNKNDVNIIKDFMNEYSSFMGYGLIHLKKRNKFIIIGGYSNSNYNAVNEIKLFDLDKLEWNKLNDIKIPKNLYGIEDNCVVTDDEKYLIIIGGTEHIVETNERIVSNSIFCLDLDSMEFKESKVIAPAGLEKEYAHATLYQVLLKPNETKLLINGLLRTKYLINDIFIPEDVLTIINKMHSFEMIDLLCDNKYGYTVNLHQLLT